MIGCGSVESKPHLCDIRQLAEHPGEDNPREKMLGKNVLQNQPGMIAWACNSGLWEAEGGGATASQ